jgi:hypothetical protein
MPPHDDERSLDEHAAETARELGWESKVSDGTRNITQRHPIITGVLAALLLIVVVVTDLINPLQLLTGILGINGIGLLAVAVVAVWRIGHRRT